MSFEELYKRISSASATMSGQERMNASILIIDSDHATRNALRQCLVQLDFVQISDAPNHLQGLDKLEQRHFTHCIFDARTTNMPARDFVIKALEMDHELICVAASYEPTIDDVFTL
ncbi:MAG: response regulator, partial [Candidatus Dadabacteria bacterium]